MRAQGKISPWTIVLFVIIALILWAISLPNYIKIKDKSVMSDRGLQLSSGVDKKSSRMDYGAGENAIGSATSPSRTYDSEYRGAAPAGAGSKKQTSSSGNSVISNALSAAGIDEGLLDTWMIPAAYAADHAVDERYLIRTGDCQIDVDDYQAASDKVEAIAHQYSGIISNSRSQRHGENWIEGYITLRIPAENFFDAWKAVLAIGEVNSESVSSQDVSQEYIGYVSELKNLLAMQATLQTMLDEALEVQRKRGLGEGYSILLDTQDRLFEVTGRIESAEDRLNALSDRITRSTITVNLMEKLELPKQVKQTREDFTWGIGTTAAEAYRDLLVRLRNIAKGLVYFLITCWTWLIPWALIIWLGTWIYRRFIKPQLAAVPAVATGDDQSGRDEGGATGDSGDGE